MAEIHLCTAFSFPQNGPGIEAPALSCFGVNFGVTDSTCLVLCTSRGAMQLNVAVGIDFLPSLCARGACITAAQQILNGIFRGE